MAVLIFKQGNYTETGSLAYAEPIFFTDANTLIISGGVSTYSNTEVSPQINAGRVDYRVATIDSINTGSLLLSGDVSASNLLLDGNATVRGNITMGGSGLDFGDASDDNVVFKADISSSFIPNNDDSFDLGSDSQRWKTGFLSNLNLSGSLFVDGGPIDLHSDTYISASAGTFLDIDVTGNTTFDGQGSLLVSSSGLLKIDSPTSISIGTNSDAPIDIDSTTLDIDSSGDITIDADNSKIAISAGTTASLDGEEGIHIGLEERAPVRIEGTSVNVNASQNVDIDADGGKLTLDGSTGIDIGVEADVPIDVDSSTLDIDASGAITISGSGVFDVNAAGALTLDSDTSISIGTDKDKPIDIDSSTLDIDSSGGITISGSHTDGIDVNTTGPLTLDSDTSISIGTDHDKPIDIDSSTLDIDASGAITIDGTSTLSIDVDGATNINTSVGGIEINSEAGSLTLDGHTGVDIDASNSGKVTIDGAQGIDIGVAADTPIDVDSSTLDIDASGAITISGSGVFDVNSAGALTLDSDTSISIGTDKDKPIDIDASTFDVDASGALTLDSNTSISIGTNDDKPIDIDSTTFDLDATSNITLDSAIGISIGTANAGTPITIGHNETSITTIGQDLSVNGNTTLAGNLTVNGTTTYVSSSNVTIGDRIIELNYLGATGNGGIYVGDADGTSTSGSLLWDSTNDNWIAGQKDLEQKILLENGDSIISGSGTNNQITTFTGTHGVDSSANLTFDGSILRITGTQEITSHLSGSASASFADLKISDDASIASLTVTDLTNDRVVIVGGGGEIEDSANLTFNGSTLGITGDVSVSATGSFGRVIGSIGSTNGVVSGSSQVDYSGLSGINNDIVSASTDSDRVNFTITDGNITADLIGGVISGSSQINVTNDIVDNAAQIAHTKLNLSGSGIISGSSQVTGITNSQLAGSIANDKLVNSGIGIGNAGTIDLGESTTTANILQGSGVVSGSSQISGLGFVTASDATKHPNWIASNLVAGTNVTITSGSDTLTIASSGGGGGGGTISGSSQIDHDATTNFVAGEHFLQSAITTVGTVTTGNVQAILPSGTISGSTQVTGITNSQLAGSIANGKLSNSGIGIGGAGTIDLGESVSVNQILNGSEVISGSLLPGTNVTINSSSDGFFISSSAAGGGANDATITLTAGTGLTGGGDFTTNQAGNESITFNFDSNSITGSFLRKLGDGVVSGSSQVVAANTFEFSTAVDNVMITLGAITHSNGTTGLFNDAGLISGSSQVSKTLQEVTTAGASTTNAITVGNGSDSTSKTTGALIVSGGLGVLNTINAGGDVVAFASSDERLKDNIKPIENPLDIISKISGNTFDWNSEKQDIYNGKDYGVIAQEIKEVMPELVDTRDSGYLAVKYDKIVPLLIESIKELKKEIEELKSK